MIGTYPPIVAASGALAVGALIALRPAIQGTTLRWAWGWSLAAVSLSVVTELLMCYSTHFNDSALRFLTATATLAPGIAILGCKRPQDAGWNFVVLSLWGIVSLPAWYALFVPIASRVEVFPALQILIVGIVLIQWANYLPTRMKWGATAITAGQVLWLAPYLLGGESLQIEKDNALPLDPVKDFGLAVRAGGMIAMAVGLVVTAWMARKRHSPTVQPLDRMWIDFRDFFGTLWSLRVQQRWLDSAQRFHWPRGLHWNGFVAVDATETGLSPPSVKNDLIQREMERTLRSLLRRFVSHDWIAKRVSAP